MPLEVDESTSRLQKLLDRSQNRVAVGYFARDDVFVLAGQLVNVVEELTAAIGTFHLAVTKQIHFRQ